MAKMMGGKVGMIAKAQASEPKMKQPAKTLSKDGAMSSGYAASGQAAAGGKSGNPIANAVKTLKKQHPDGGQNAEMQHARHVALHGMKPTKAWTD